MPDSLSFLSSMGLDGAWLPILVALLAVPTQYVLLGMSAHQEFREVAAALADKRGRLKARERADLDERAGGCLRIFELDWWIVGAFGILVTIIILSGHLSDWSKIASGTSNTAVEGYRCVASALQTLTCSLSPKEVPSGINNVMSLYATFVSLLIGFRLGWARLQLAKELGQYYVVGRDGQDAPSKGNKSMPPSGYNSQQAGYLREFLRSCAAALLAEARTKRITLVEALAAEIRDIDGHLASGLSSDAQSATLVMTKAFYQKILKAAPSDNSFNGVMREAADEVYDEVVKVKVVPQAAE